MKANQVEGALNVFVNFIEQFERTYQTHIQTPHIQCEIDLIELIRAAKLGKHNRAEVISTGVLTLDYGKFNLTLIEK